MEIETGLAERLSLLEEKVGKPTPSMPPTPIEARLAKVEAALAQPPTPKRKDRWEKAQVLVSALSPLLTGLTLAFLAYFLTGRITNALAQRKLELDNVTQIRDLLVKMRIGKGEGPTPPQAEMNADALALAAFGPYAVPPLIQLLETGGDVAGEAADKGLRSLLLTYPEETCEQLGRALANRSQAFSWQTHRHLLHLAGDLDCRRQIPLLRSYRALVLGAKDRAGLKRYQERIDAQADPDSIEQLQQEIDRTWTILNRPEEPHGQS
jgi:hypothetical protein